MTQRELDRLRARMDRLDRQICALLLKRVQLSDAIVRQKKAAGFPARDRRREAVILKRLIKGRSPRVRRAIKAIYSALFSLRKS